MMKALYYVLVLALIFFRGIVIEAAKKSRPKGDITKDQIQSPTPGSNNVREYTVEHTPELGEEPSQKKIRRQGNSKRKSTAMSHLNELKLRCKTPAFKHDPMHLFCTDTLLTGEVVVVTNLFNGKRASELTHVDVQRTEPDEPGARRRPARGWPWGFEVSPISGA